ncbi:hypothetical protein [Myxosarcina sp. GI1(2024)]
MGARKAKPRIEHRGKKTKAIATTNSHLNLSWRDPAITAMLLTEA